MVGKKGRGEQQVWSEQEGFDCNVPGVRRLEQYNNKNEFGELYKHAERTFGSCGNGGG